MGKMIHISNDELRSHGCINCVWDSNGQCCHSKDKDTIVDICQEYMNFIVGFAEGSDSASAMWEKFNLYVARLQSLEDFREFKRLDAEIRDKSQSSHIDYGKLQELEAKRNALKLWWIKLNEQVTKGLSRVVDREQKIERSEVPRLTVQQLNVLINDAGDKLIAHEKKMLDAKVINNDETKP